MFEYIAVVPLGYFGDIEGNGHLDPLSKANVVMAKQYLEQGEAGLAIFPKGRALRGRGLVGLSMKHHLKELNPSLSAYSVCLGDPGIDTTYKELLAAIEYVAQHPSIKWMRFVANPLVRKRVASMLTTVLSPVYKQELHIDTLQTTVEIPTPDLLNTQAQRVFQEREKVARWLYQRSWGRNLETGQITPAIVKQLWEEYWARKILAAA